MVHTHSRVLCSHKMNEMMLFAACMNDSRDYYTSEMSEKDNTYDVFICGI